MDKMTADWITEFNAMIAELEGPEKDEEVDLSSGLVPTSNAGLVPKTALSGGLVRKRHSNELINRILHRHAKLTGASQ